MLTVPSRDAPFYVDPVAVRLVVPAAERSCWLTIAGVEAPWLVALDAADLVALVDKARREEQTAIAEHAARTGMPVLPPPPAPSAALALLVDARDALAGVLPLLPLGPLTIQDAHDVTAPGNAIREARAVFADLGAFLSVLGR